MATLQKIRNKGPLLVIVIGLALFAFIAEEAMRSIVSSSNRSHYQAGEIYGEAISVNDYQDLVDEYEDVVKFTSGSNTLNDAQLTQIRDQVWNNYVNQSLIRHEAEALGLTVTDNEVRSIILEGNSPILAQTPFRNEQTGRFDANILEKFLADYESLKSQSDQVSAEYTEYYDKLFDYWMFIEKSIREECLVEKYQALLTKSILSNKITDKLAFDNRSKQYDLLLTSLSYSSVKDSEVTVNESELNAKYNELKEMFKQPVESRDIKYIDVQVTASAADKAALDQEMAEIAQSLASGEETSKVVRESGSVIGYSQIPVSKNIFPLDIANQLDTLAVGQMKAPYYFSGDNTMNIIKLLGKYSMPDSIEYRQIQIAGADMATVSKTADSVMNVLRSGVEFDSIAKNFNQTGAKTWLTSRMYEGSTFDEDNLKYINTITQMPVNTTEKLEMTQGYIILQVTDRRNIINKYDVAVIKRTVDFSKETYAKAYNDFSHFVASSPTQKDIEEKALKNGYNVQERRDIYTNEHYVGGVNNTREALRWIFNDDTEKGDISPLYECGDNDHMLIVILTGVHKPGYRSMEDVREYLTEEVMKDKKAKILSDKMASAKTLDDVSKIKGAVTDSVKYVTFGASAYVTNTATTEAIITAVACKAPLNKLINQIKGKGGVYALQVYNKVDMGGKFNPEKERENQEARLSRNTIRFMNDLFERAEVKDNRYRFF